jgi:hypothetical protein
MAAAVATWWLGKSPPPQANAAPEPGAETGAEPTLAMDDPLPALEGGAVTVDSLGDPFFTWVNPSPAEGDQYHWTLLATPDKAHLTGDVRLAVPRREFGDGPVCVEVRLVRDEKTSPDELRICEG